MKQVKFKGTQLNLIGRNIKKGDFAPDFTIVSSELEEVPLKNSMEKSK